MVWVPREASEPVVLDVVVGGRVVVAGELWELSVVVAVVVDVTMELMTAVDVEGGGGGGVMVAGAAPLIVTLGLFSAALGSTAI